MGGWQFSAELGEGLLKKKRSSPLEGRTIVEIVKTARSRLQFRSEPFERHEMPNMGIFRMNWVFTAATRIAKLA